MNTITYGGVAFPCSLVNATLPDSGFAATQAVKTCILEQLMKLGRPEDLHVRKQWMLRFIGDMHWLPLIKVLSGCHEGANPSAYAAFMKQLKALDVPRIAHRSISILDQEAWGRHLNRELKVRVPDPVKWASVCGQGFHRGRTKRDVLFVGDEFVAAAETARPDCRKELPWLLYKAVAVVKGQLDPDGHRDMLLASYGNDPSSEAYWRFIKDRKP